MKDIQYAITNSRGIWFCLIHPDSFKKFYQEITPEQEAVYAKVRTWIDKGLNLCLSPENLSVYKQWLCDMAEERIKYFQDNIPDCIEDIYAELYDADVWLSPEFLDLDIRFHQMFIDCYLNNDYFKNDPPGVNIEKILDTDGIPYASRLIAYLYLLRECTNLQAITEAFKDEFTEENIKVLKPEEVRS